MRWNRLIPPYLLKCAYLSNWTGLWIAPSSYLLFPPWDASPHFFCISAPFFNNLFHSFIIFIAIAIHTTFLEPADMIFHTVFHYSHSRYSKVISPMCSWLPVIMLFKQSIRLLPFFLSMLNFESLVWPIVCCLMSQESKALITGSTKGVEIFWKQHG